MPSHDSFHVVITNIPVLCIDYLLVTEQYTCGRFNFLQTIIIFFLYILAPGNKLTYKILFLIGVNSESLNLFYDIRLHLQFCSQIIL